MYIKDIKTSTLFVKHTGVTSKGIDLYFVSEAEADGVLTVTTTTDIFKASRFTLKEVIDFTYSEMDNDARQHLYKAYEQNDSYELLFRKFRHHGFYVVAARKIDYGYGSDAEAEKKLLTELDMTHIFTRPIIVEKVLEDLENEK